MNNLRRTKILATLGPASSSSSSSSSRSAGPLAALFGGGPDPEKVQRNRERWRKADSLTRQYARRYGCDATAQQINDLNANHTQTINDLNATHGTRIANLQTNHNNQVNVVQQQHTHQLNQQQVGHQNTVNLLNNTVNNLHASHATALATQQTNHNNALAAQALVHHTQVQAFQQSTTTLRQRLRESQQEVALANRAVTRRNPHRPPPRLQREVRALIES